MRCRCSPRVPIEEQHIVNYLSTWSGILVPSHISSDGVLAPRFVNGVTSVIANLPNPSALKIEVGRTSGAHLYYTVALDITWRHHKTSTVASLIMKGLTGYRWPFLMFFWCFDIKRIENYTFTNAKDIHGNSKNTPKIGNSFHIWAQPGGDHGFRPSQLRSLRQVSRRTSQAIPGFLRHSCPTPKGTMQAGPVRAKMLGAYHNLWHWESKYDDYDDQREGNLQTKPVSLPWDSVLCGLRMLPCLGWHCFEKLGGTTQGLTLSYSCKWIKWNGLMIGCFFYHFFGG